ncbi:MAG TPA: formyltransferase family protein [Ktedonobacteraceae bacterium]|nr:formyltransferase family protein [Ktedonobacteraceae bacterium]
MSNLLDAPDKPRVLFFGMLGQFSYASLDALLKSGIQICAAVIPSNQDHDENLQAIVKQEQYSSTRSKLPLLNSSIHTSILDLAHSRNIPIWKVRQLSNPDTIKVLQVYQPDMICVACFSMRIPRDILDIPHLGFLNVHPSLLPANRGPEPLFWTFREGDERTGVTVHIMDEGLDSGAIVAQEAFDIPDGITYSELETWTADLGGKLLARSVWDIYHGVTTQVKQDETKSSYHAFPCDKDFVIPSAEWSARHVYNFVCGVESWGIPIYLLIENTSIHIKKVISYSLEATKTDKLPENECWVRCKRGSVLIEKNS